MYELLKNIQVIAHLQMCFISVKLLSVLFPAALIQLYCKKDPQSLTYTWQHHHKKSNTHSQIEDIAMMDTKAKGWKMRPDITSSVFFNPYTQSLFPTTVSSTHKDAYKHLEKHTLNHKSVTDRWVTQDPVKPGGMLWLLSHSFTDASPSISELMCLSLQRWAERRSCDLSQIAWTRLSMQSLFHVTV